MIESIDGPDWKIRISGEKVSNLWGLAITHAHANKAMARLALADGVIGAGKGKYKAGRSR